MMNSSRCKMCGRLILAGTLCFHAAAHPFDHPHNHTPSPSESVLVLGKIGVSSATTQQVPSMLSSALSTSFKTVTIREHPTAQNALLSLWITYLNTRLQLYRDLELMPIDNRGVWIDDLATCDVGPGQERSSQPGLSPSGTQGPGSGGEDTKPSERSPQPEFLPPPASPGAKDGR